MKKLVWSTSNKTDYNISTVFGKNAAKNLILFPNQEDFLTNPDYMQFCREFYIRDYNIIAFFIKNANYVAVCNDFKFLVENQIQKTLPTYVVGYGQVDKFLTILQTSGLLVLDNPLFLSIHRTMVIQSVIAANLPTLFVYSTLDPFLFGYTSFSGQAVIETSIQSKRQRNITTETVIIEKIPIVEMQLENIMSNDISRMTKETLLHNSLDGIYIDQIVQINDFPYLTVPEFLALSILVKQGMGLPEFRGSWYIDAVNFFATVVTESQSIPHQEMLLGLESISEDRFTFAQRTVQEYVSAVAFDQETGNLVINYLSGNTINIRGFPSLKTLGKGVQGNKGQKGSGKTHYLPVIVEPPEIGPVGAMGPTGYVGEMGDIGNVGPTGKTGEIGPVGKDGDIGKVGKTGLAGGYGVYVGEDDPGQTLGAKGIWLQLGYKFEVCAEPIVTTIKPATTVKPIITTPRLVTTTTTTTQHWQGGCLVHFQGTCLSNETGKWYVTPFVGGTYNDIGIVLGTGSYTDATITLKKPKSGSLDTIAVQSGATLTIWSGKNFTGTKIEFIGPYFITSEICASDAYNKQRNISWSESGHMIIPKYYKQPNPIVNAYANGSLTIECLETTTPQDTTQPDTTTPQDTTQPDTTQPDTTQPDTTTSTTTTTDMQCCGVQLVTVKLRFEPGGAGLAHDKIFIAPGGEWKQNYWDIELPPGCVIKSGQFIPVTVKVCSENGNATTVLVNTIQYLIDGTKTPGADYSFTSVAPGGLVCGDMNAVANAPSKVKTFSGNTWANAVLLNKNAHKFHISVGSNAGNDKGWVELSFSIDTCK